MWSGKWWPFYLCLNVLIRSQHWWRWMSWCHQATSRSLRQGWPRSRLPYVINSPQCIYMMDRLTSLPEWISNHRPTKLWEEIIFPFLNFKWISNSIYQNFINQKLFYLVWGIVYHEVMYKITCVSHVFGHLCTWFQIQLFSNEQLIQISILTDSSNFHEIQYFFHDLEAYQNFKEFSRAMRTLYDTGEMASLYWINLYTPTGGLRYYMYLTMVWCRIRCAPGRFIITNFVFTFLKRSSKRY